MYKNLLMAGLVVATVVTVAVISTGLSLHPAFVMPLMPKPGG
jgi:hypothetical protein